MFDKAEFFSPQLRWKLKYSLCHFPPWRKEGSQGRVVHLWHLCLYKSREMKWVYTQQGNASVLSLPPWEPPFQWSHCRSSLPSVSASEGIWFSWSPHMPARTQCSLHRTQTSEKLGKQQHHLGKGRGERKAKSHQLSIPGILNLPICHICS